MALPPSHSQSLLPRSDILILDRIERDADRFRLIVHVEQEPACPVCGESSTAQHSCYLRHLHDLPWQGVSVELWATVGRFRCRNPPCPRKIFCERLPHVARVYARQTERAAEIVRLSSPDGQSDAGATPPQLTSAQLRRQRRLERYEQVVSMFNSGQSQAAIARALGLERKTIRRWLRSGQFPERKPPHRRPPKGEPRC